MVVDKAFVGIGGDVGKGFLGAGFVDYGQSFLGSYLFYLVVDLFRLEDRPFIIFSCHDFVFESQELKALTS